MSVSGELSRVYLSVHTPRYCTYEAAFAGKVAHPDFKKAAKDCVVCLTLACIRFVRVTTLRR